MTDRELMQQALDALHTARPACFADNTLEAIDNAIVALRERLAQPESVKFNCTVVDDAHPEGVPLSQWGRQPLKLREIERCIHDANNDPIVACRNVEAAHGIGEKPDAA